MQNIKQSQGWHIKSSGFCLSRILHYFLLCRVPLKAIWNLFESHLKSFWKPKVLVGMNLKFLLKAKPKFNSIHDTCSKTENISALAARTVPVNNGWLWISKEAAGAFYISPIQQCPPTMSTRTWYLSISTQIWNLNSTSLKTPKKKPYYIIPAIAKWKIHFLIPFGKFWTKYNFLNRRCPWPSLQIWGMCSHSHCETFQHIREHYSTTMHLRDQTHLINYKREEAKVFGN